MTTGSRSMTFESSRSMGRAGTLILLIVVVISPILFFSSVFFQAAFPAAIVITVVTGVLSFTGNILVLVAMNRFADFYQTPHIFRNALYGFLSSIIGGIALSIVLYGFVASMIPSLYTPPGNSGGPPVASAVFPFFAALAIIWIGLFLIVLIQSIFYRASLNALAAKSCEENFKTAGLLILIGGALTLVAIGVFVFFVGWIFAAMGFFYMKPPPTQNYPTVPPANASAMLPKKTCPNCGASNTETAIYCSHCGKPV
jgi:uncharacterized membrane protein